MGKERSEAERAERKAQKQRAKEQEAASAPSSKKTKRKSEDADVDGMKKKKKAPTQDVDAAASDDEIPSPGQNGEIAPVPLLPFAEPLADDKQKHKILKAIRRGTKHRTLKRGVKEITKAARKMPDTTPGSSADKAPAVAIIAGDVWPEDVVSHIPVQCEEKNIPFIFIDSRKELGEAGATKRPTSCLLLTRDKPVAKNPTDAKASEDGKETWEETYKSVLKMVNKERSKYSW